MSSKATGDTKQDQAAVTDQPAAADAAGPSVTAAAPQGPAAGAAEESTKGAAVGSIEGSSGDERAAGTAGTATAEQAGDEADPDGRGSRESGDENAGSGVTEPERRATQDTGPGEAAKHGPDAEEPAQALDGDDGFGDPDPAARIELSEPVQRAEPVEEFPPGRRWPRVLLALGFVMAAAAIVGGAIIIVGSLTHGFKKPVKVTYKKSAVFSLKTGNCLDPQGQSYTLIACASPHEAEVFATFTLAGSKWPGNSAVATAASGGCASRLSSYLNPELAVSLARIYVYPDAVAWQAGTRTVICEVRASSGKLTGSVRGASASTG